MSHAHVFPEFSNIVRAFTNEDGPLHESRSGLFTNTSISTGNQGSFSDSHGSECTLASISCEGFLEQPVGL